METVTNIHWKILSTIENCRIHECSDWVFLERGSYVIFSSISFNMTSIWPNITSFWMFIFALCLTFIFHKYTENHVEISAVTRCTHASCLRNKLILNWSFYKALILIFRVVQLLYDCAFISPKYWSFPEDKRKSILCHLYLAVEN